MIKSNPVLKGIRWLPVVLLSLCVGCAPLLPTPDAVTERPTRQPATAAPSVLPPVATLPPALPSLPPPTATSEPSPVPTATLPPPVWTYIAPGIGQAALLAAAPETGADIRINAIQLDPALVTFQVYYDAAEPKSIGEWLSVTGATLVFNGGFFASDNRPVGQLVIDGQLYGAPIDLAHRVGISGLFAVVDNQADVYALGTSNYAPRGMRFEEAVEGYPMLLLPGQQAIYPPRSGRRARRTVIGIDAYGDVILLTIDTAAFSLYELSQWLATSNLHLASALNLDGGRSTGMALNAPNQHTLIPAYVPLPIVVAVYVREG